MAEAVSNRPPEKRWSVPCGRMYDPSVDDSFDLFPCESWARWEIVARDGLVHYACGSHINKVLSDLVQDRRADLAVRDLRTI